MRTGGQKLRKRECWACCVMWLDDAEDPRFSKLVDWTLDEGLFQVFSYIVHHPVWVWNAVQRERRWRGLEVEPRPLEMGQGRRKSG